MDSSSQPTGTVSCCNYLLLHRILASKMDDVLCYYVREEDASCMNEPFVPCNLIYCILKYFMIMLHFVCTVLFTGKQDFVHYCVNFFVST